MFTIGPWSQESLVFIYSDLLLWSLVRRAAPQSEQSGGEEKTFGTKTDSQVPQILEICLFHGGFTPEGNININTPTPSSRVPVQVGYRHVPGLPRQRRGVGWPPQPQRHGEFNPAPVWAT